MTRPDSLISDTATVVPVPTAADLTTTAGVFTVTDTFLPAVFHWVCYQVLLMETPRQNLNSSQFHLKRHGDILKA